MSQRSQLIFDSVKHDLFSARVLYISLFVSCSFVTLHKFTVLAAIFAATIACLKSCKVNLEFRCSDGDMALSGHSCF